MREFRRCSKTVLDNIADDVITFDENGVCNYYYEYQQKAKEKLVHGEEGKRLWQSKVEEIKRVGQRKTYDCIIGVSGGVDSTYVAYLIKEAKLRPLIVHFDNGWNSEIAVQNINNIVEALEGDLYSLVVDWEEFRDLQRAYIKAGVVDIEVLTDHAIIGTLYRLAAKHNIRYIISGTNVETEYVMPKSWIYNKLDSINIKDIHQHYGEMELSSYPIFSILRKKFLNKLKKLEIVTPLNWESYNKEEVKKKITHEMGWTDYGGKHHESVFTKFYQNYILPQKFKIDKRKAHLSNLICSGQMSREEALRLLEEPIYDPKELKIDKEYVLKKLGFTEAEFDAMMKEKPRRHEDFKTEGPIGDHFPLLKPIKTIYRIFK